MESALAFTISITKADNSQLIVDALAGDSGLIADSFRIVPAGEANRDNKELYGGIELSSLEESFQSAFLDFLSERGIDDEFSFFLAKYCIDKDATEFKNGLVQLSKF